MPGFGLAGAAGFASGFGPAFNQSLHQSQELQLERQRLQMQQDRERNAKAEDDRAHLYDVISKHAQAMRAMNQDPKLIMKTLEPNISALERLTKSLGRDPTLIRMEFGMMLSQPTSADVERGGAQGQTAQQQAPRQAPAGDAGPVQQAASDAAFSQAPSGVMPGQPMPQGPSPAAPGVQPVPFMQGEVGGAAQPTATGTMPPPPQAQPPQAQPQQSEELNTVRDEQIDRLGRALSLASVEKDAGQVKKLELKLAQLIKERYGKTTRTFKSEDGGIDIYDINTGRSMHMPAPEADASQQHIQPEKSRYGLPDLTPDQMAILNRVQIGPREFDYEAILTAYGSQKYISGQGRDKKSRDFARQVQNRATQYFKSLGLTPDEALAVQTEMQAIAVGARNLEKIASAQSQAFSRVEADAPILKERSHAIPRTDYPLLNEAILQWDEQTGGTKAKEIPKFFVALETLALNYATALGNGSGVMTDSRAEHARALMKKAWSAGQLDAAIDQMQVELARQKQQSIRAVHVFIRGAMAEAQRSMRSGAGGSGDKKTYTDDDLNSMSLEELEELKRDAD